MQVNPKLRAEACRVLGQIGTKKKSLARLLRLAKDDDFFVRNSANRAVQAIRGRGD